MIHFRWPFYGLRLRWPIQRWKRVSEVSAAEFIPEIWSQERARATDEYIEAIHSKEERVL